MSTTRSATPRWARFAGGVLFSVLLGMGCGAGRATPADAAPSEQGFAACGGVDAGPYTPGMVAWSVSARWKATVLSAVTTSSDGPPVDAPAVGLSTFTISIADDLGRVPTGLAMTADKPYMPFHGHSASIVPDVTDEGHGQFTISDVSFFMTGYFQLGLNLLGSGNGAASGDGGVPQAPADGAAAPPAPLPDRIVLGICVPA